MTESSAKIKYLVADTTAFINAVQLNEIADFVLTVPDVLEEVKHKRQIRRLCVLPFDLQVREPRAESVKHCVEFAKKTGDYASLSGIDIKVISLAYELEIDNVGSEHLRKEPVLSKIIASKEKPEEFEKDTKLAGWYNPKKGEESEDDDEIASDDEDEEDSENDLNRDEMGNEPKSSDKADAVKEAIEKQLDESHYNEQDEISQEDLEKCFAQLKCELAEDDKTCDLLVPTSQSQDHSDSEDSMECAESDAKGEREETASTSHVEANDDIDDSAWITPSNLKKVKKSLEGKLEDDIIPVVACMSTDFALQNVLKQMNLHVSALNGRIIKHLRTYILRCYACFKTTSIMTKVFCPNCGNKTLKRVAVSLDENGKQVIHINTRRPLTTKYKNQAMPRFKGGKHSRNPILFEDQPIPRQMPSRVAKTKTNALDDDYIAGYSPFVMRDVDSKSAMLRAKGNIKEWARNNTFEEDRRRKNYNRLYK